MVSNAVAHSARPLRRLAPYMHEIRAEMAAGRHPNLFCFAGSDAWKRAERRRESNGLASVTLLPPAEYPDSYIWPCVDALVLIPSDCKGVLLRDLIREFLIAGCRCVAEVRGRGATFHYSREPTKSGGHQ